MSYWRHETEILCSWTGPCYANHLCCKWFIKVKKTLEQQVSTSRNNEYTYLLPTLDFFFPKAPGRYHPSLFSNEIVTSPAHWISSPPSMSEENPFICMFKFQHTEWTIPCQIWPVEDNKLRVYLSISTRAVTPGQVSFQFPTGWTCVFYKIWDQVPIKQTLFYSLPFFTTRKNV